MHVGVVVASLASLRWWHLCDHLKEVREWAVCVSGRKAFPGRRNGQCKGPEGRNLLCLRNNKGLCGWRWVSVEYLKVMRFTWKEQLSFGNTILELPRGRAWHLDPRPPNHSYFAISTGQATRESSTLTWRAVGEASALHGQRVWQPLRLQAEVFQIEWLSYVTTFSVTSNSRGMHIRAFLWRTRACFKSQANVVQILALLLTRWVTLGEWCNLSQPHIFHL